MIQQIFTDAINNLGIVLIMLTIDTITGIIKALRDGGFTSNKLRNALNKLIVYFFVIVIGTCVSASGDVVVMSALVGFISIVEGISILENLNKIFPNLEIMKKIKRLLVKKSNKYLKED